MILKYFRGRLFTCIKSEINSIKRLPHFIGCKMFGGQGSSPNNIVYIADGADWAIKWVGYYIAKGVNSRRLHCKLDTSPRFYFNSIIHFGSLATFVGNSCFTFQQSNKLIATIFHGNQGNSPQMSAGIDKLLVYKNKLARIVVSNSIMKKRLISWGVQEEKLVQIPIGVDLTYFRQFEGAKRNKLRNELGIPNGAVCIGSFQKDGNGWGEGFDPKLIKGPDIFVEVVSRLAKKYKIHCLLTGPARGYVKRNLEANGVPYTHHFLDRYLDIVNYYNCADLCLVTSREEGGPNALMESMATGVPLVSTHVGMAPDMLRNGENGFMVEVDDIKGIVSWAEKIIEDEEIRTKIINNGLQTVRKYDWDVIAGQYAELYRKVMKETPC